MARSIELHKSATGYLFDRAIESRDYYVEGKKNPKIAKISISVGLALIAVPLVTLVLIETLFRAIIGSFFWMASKANDPNSLYKKYFEGSFAIGCEALSKGTQAFFLTWRCETRIEPVEKKCLLIPKPKVVIKYREKEEEPHRTYSRTRRLSTHLRSPIQRSSTTPPLIEEDSRVRQIDELKEMFGINRQAESGEQQVIRKLNDIINKKGPGYRYSGIERDLMEFFHINPDEIDAQEVFIEKVDDLAHFLNIQGPSNLNPGENRLLTRSRTPSPNGPPLRRVVHFASDPSFSGTVVQSNQPVVDRIQTLFSSKKQSDLLENLGALANSLLTYRGDLYKALEEIEKEPIGEEGKEWIQEILPLIKNIGNKLPIVYRLVICFVNLFKEYKSCEVRNFFELIGHFAIAGRRGFKESNLKKCLDNESYEKILIKALQSLVDTEEEVKGISSQIIERLGLQKSSKGALRNIYRIVRELSPREEEEGSGVELPKQKVLENRVETRKEQIEVEETRYIEIGLNQLLRTVDVRLWSEMDSVVGQRVEMERSVKSLESRDRFYRTQIARYHEMAPRDIERWNKGVEEVIQRAKKRTEEELKSLESYAEGVENEREKTKRKKSEPNGELKNIAQFFNLLVNCPQEGIRKALKKEREAVVNEIASPRPVDSPNFSSLADPSSSRDPAADDSVIITPPPPVSVSIVDVRPPSVSVSMVDVPPLVAPSNFSKMDLILRDVQQRADREHLTAWIHMCQKLKEKYRDRFPEALAAIFRKGNIGIRGKFSDLRGAITTNIEQGNYVFAIEQAHTLRQKYSDETDDSCALDAANYGADKFKWNGQSRPSLFSKRTNREEYDEFVRDAAEFYRFLRHAPRVDGDSRLIGRALEALIERPSESQQSTELDLSSSSST